MKIIFLLLSALLVSTDLLSHDAYEITIEIQQKRKTIEATLEMARSTAVAACDPAPSQGILFDPEEFPEWEPKFQEVAADLIRILDTEGAIALKSTKPSLSREDDVQIDYEFENVDELPLVVETPILNRFPKEGFGVRVSFRDKSGKWYPPFLIYVEKPSAELPPR